MRLRRNGCTVLAAELGRYADVVATRAVYSMSINLEQRYAQASSVRRLLLPLAIAAIRIAAMIWNWIVIPIFLALALDVLVFASGWWAMAPLRSAYGQDLRNRNNGWGLLYLPWAVGGILLLRDTLTLLR